MTLNEDTVLPPWMRNILTKEEEAEILRQQQIPLYIEPPMPKEQRDEESDVIEQTIIEIDI